MLDKSRGREYAITDNRRDRGGSGMKDNPVVKALLYAVSGSLIVFYLYVIYLGTDPQVSDEYRAYYIDQTIPEWPY
ncbi:MAG: hypothetical protein K1W23_08645 [Lachnospiraceae bacterium]